MAKRRRVPVDMGILREAYQLMLKNVTERLGRTTVEQDVAKDEAGFEDYRADKVFTQVLSWQVSPSGLLSTRLGEQQLHKGTKRSRKQGGRAQLL